MFNIDPKRWGRPMWDSLYYICASYPDSADQDEQETIKTYFTIIGRLLPCEICRSNYKNHIKKHPITNDVLKSRYDLINWLISIDNEIRSMHGKPLITYEQVVAKYITLPQPFITNKMIISLVLILLIVMLIVFAKYKSCFNL